MSAPTPRPDRGATLVEMAIVGLLVFTLILAVFEFGLLFRDNLTVTDAVADATRIGAIVGPDVSTSGATADYEIVKALREGMSAMSDTDIRTITVFLASGSGEDAEAQVPAPCRNGNAIRNICNTYDAAAAFTAVEAGNVAYFTCAGANTSACPWDPTKRKDGPKSSDVQTLGVYVRIARPGYTGLFGDSWTISRASVNRLEPGVAET